MYAAMVAVAMTCSTADRTPDHSSGNEARLAYDSGIEAYLKLCPYRVDGEGPLFVGVRGGPLGPRVILVTSVLAQETPRDCIDLVVSSQGARFRVRTPMLPVAINGAGDAISALFFVHYLQTRDMAEALARAASSVYGLLRRTAEAGSREILLVAAQDEFVNPSTRFAAERL